MSTKSISLIRLIYLLTFLSTTSLAGTCHLSGSINSNKSPVALFSCDKNKTLVVRRGDIVFDGYVLKQVIDNYVNLSKNGRTLTFYMNEDIILNTKLKKNADPILRLRDGIERRGNTILFSESISRELQGNSLARMIMDIRARYFSNKDVIGYQVDLIDVGSLYDLIGIKNNDVVTHIDDIELDGILNAMEALKSSRGSPIINISIYRNGTSKNLRLVTR